MTRTQPDLPKDPAEYRLRRPGRVQLGLMLLFGLACIAAGAGVTVQDVNQLIRQYEQARQMVKQMMGNKKGMLRKMQGFK